MRTGKRLLPYAVWLLIAGPQLVTSMAHAQAAPPAAETSDAAREHFKRGEAAYQKGSYDAAITEWEAAYAADPRPRIQYNLYQAYERLGQLTKASEALQRYLSTADPDDPSYSDATARMSALQQRLQATGIRLVGGVDGAAINVSGQDWGRLPRPDKISVQPGNHRVVVTLAGYKDFTANVVVPAGQVVDVAIQLEPNGAEAGPATAPPTAGTTQLSTTPPPSADRGGNDTTAFYIAAGVLGAGAIGSAIWAINRVGELKGCSDAEFYCPKEDAVKTQRNIAFGVTAVLGAGAIGALIYAIVAGRKDKPDHALASCQPGVLGGQCQLRF